MTMGKGSASHGGGSLSIGIWRNRFAHPPSEIPSYVLNLWGQKLGGGVCVCVGGGRFRMECVARELCG